MWLVQRSCENPLMCKATTMSDIAAETQDNEYDPFAEFDLFAGAGAVRDPFPVWDELRGQVPGPRRRHG